jgi:hypothetical protein
MKTKLLHWFLLLALLVSACTPASLAAAHPVFQPANHANDEPSTSPTQTTPVTDKLVDNSQQPAKNNGGTPPKAAIEACASKASQDICEFTSQKGSETGVCEMVQDNLACSPKQGHENQNQAGSAEPQGQRDGNQTGDPSQIPQNASQSGDQQQKSKDADPPSTQVNPSDNQKQQTAENNPPAGNGSGYNIEQAVSDKAQGMTIAYDALAFMTGDLGSDSFFPPGKVADYWGFQYLRDNDPSEMGHAGDFLTSAAMNMLNVMTADQRSQLVALAKSQVTSINEYGYKRFVLIKAFRRLVSGDLPAGTTGLNEDAVKAYSGQLYQLDGQISYARAQLMGQVLNSLSTGQKAYLDAMVGKGMLEWPKVEEPADIRGLDRDVKVAVMTYAADMFSWYAGSVDADIYFCPERHGTYFGSFYLKDIPAMSNSSYAIPTTLTGDMGENMLKVLTPEQTQKISGLVGTEKPYLQGIVETRRAISTELRKFKDGSAADSNTVQNLMDKYGQLDGEIIYNLAINFTAVSQSLTDNQNDQLLSLRKQMLGELMYPQNAYLYSQAIPMPEIANTDFLFK